MSSGDPKIRRGRAAGLVLRLLGKRNYGARLKATKLTLYERIPREISLTELSAPVRVTKSLGFHEVTLEFNDGSKVCLSGVKRAEAVAFSEQVNSAWHRVFAEAFDTIENELRALAEMVERLEKPRRYPSACLVEPFVERASVLAAQFPNTLPDGVLNIEQRRILHAVIQFQKSPEWTRETAIKTFIDAELTEMRGFFDQIEANPLTPEQRLAVVTDEDATLVLAGAGSGKTSVIVAKTAYLIRRGIRQPQEILLMAFSKDAAEEMAARIEERCGFAVNTRTFHAMGYEIIRNVEGQAPAMAAHANDDAPLRTLLRDILVNDVVQRKGLGGILIQWFSEFYWHYKSEWDFKSRDEYYQYVESQELRTLQGERVRSFEECQIANWLFVNGIAYEYEPLYEHKLPDNSRRAYTPDFRLQESGVYIEHFGVRKNQGPDGATIFTTAPNVDRDSYLEDMEWKRKVHREHGTTLIETFSYERVEGRLIEALAEKLAPHTTPKPISSDQILSTLSKMGQVDAFTLTLGTFLRHFKSAGLTVEKCRKRGVISRDSARNLAFLKIFEPLLAAYQQRLGERVDFEDMINRATAHVKAGRYRSPYRHLLVDEFQDISEGRAQFLHALKEQHDDSRIFAVGDDWQSIYRFTGSDINLMRNFGNEFGGVFAGSTGAHSIVDLGRTFRSVDKIALPARTFILENPSQIKKQVIPAGTADAPAIKVAYYTLGQEKASLKTALGEIQTETNRAGKVSVLLLGRYHFLRPENLADLLSIFPNLSIHFMTVHASKGLEADHVIILRAVSGRMGFPTEIVDDPLLDMVLPKPEKFDHAEERRLFYVALTRARKSVTVLSNSEKPSVFIRELVEDEKYEVVQIGKQKIAKHRCGACGGRMLAHTSRSGNRQYTCEHRFLCGEKLRPCSVCNNDLPVEDDADPVMLVCSCGAKFQTCPECNNGWLVVRKGRYGTFLGCIMYPVCRGTKRHVLTD